jgi:hypothetical protein
MSLHSHHRGVRDELRVRDRNARLGSLGGIVRINGITAVLNFVSSADIPAAAGMTELTVPTNFWCADLFFRAFRPSP